MGWLKVISCTILIMLGLNQVLKGSFGSILFGGLLSAIGIFWATRRKKNK